MFSYSNSVTGIFFLNKVNFIFRTILNNERIFKKNCSSNGKRQNDPFRDRTQLFFTKTIIYKIFEFKKKFENNLIIGLI